MDTRTKILDTATGKMVVAGYFDPVVATHTARLRELAAQFGPLTVCVCEPPQPLLPPRARAELVAALRDVERVVIGDSALSGFARVVDEREGDAARRDELMRRVYARQGD